MNIENLLINAIKKNEFKAFLRGEGEYMVETSQYCPVAYITDVGRVLASGIYEIYTYDESIKQKFEECLLQMVYTSDFDIFMVFEYLFSQIFKENHGIAPFTLPKETIADALSIQLKQREDNIKKELLIQTDI